MLTHILLATSASLFSQFSTEKFDLPPSNNIEIADFDGDRRPDKVFLAPIFAFTEIGHVLYADGKIVKIPMYPNVLLATIKAAKAIDLNQDSYLDLITIDSRSNISFYLGNRDRTFTYSHTLTLSTIDATWHNYSNITICDIDNDNKDDILLSIVVPAFITESEWIYNSFVIYGKNTKSFRILGLDRLGNAQICKINNQDNILAIERSRLKLHIFDPSKSLVLPTKIYLPENIRRTKAVDLDEDGTDEIICISLFNIYVFKYINGSYLLRTAIPIQDPNFIVHTILSGTLDNTKGEEFVVCSTNSNEHKISVYNFEGVVEELFFNRNLQSVTQKVFINDTYSLQDYDGDNVKDIVIRPFNTSGIEDSEILWAKGQRKGNYNKIIKQKLTPNISIRFSGRPFQHSIESNICSLLVNAPSEYTGPILVMLSFNSKDRVVKIGDLEFGMFPFSPYSTYCSLMPNTGIVSFKIPSMKDLKIPPGVKLYIQAVAIKNNKLVLSDTLVFDYSDVRSYDY